MADEDFDINCVLEISYGIREPGGNRESSPGESSSVPNSPSNDEVILGLVPDEDWIGNRLPRKEDKEIEDAERARMYKKICQYEEKVEANVSFVQQISNGWDCNTSVARNSLTVSSVETPDVNVRKVSHLEHYRCTTCLQVFSDITLMSKHSWTHPTRRKPFACNICGKQESELSNLKMHIRFHTGEASSTCTVCHKTFHTADMLKIHMRSHSGAFPKAAEDALSKFRCHICMRPFTRQCHLNKHFRIHTSEKWFPHQEYTMQQIQHQS